MNWLVHNACLTGNTDNIHWSKFLHTRFRLTENAKDGWGYVYPIVNTLFYNPFQLDTKVQPGHDYVRIIFDTYTIFVVC